MTKCTAVINGTGEILQSFYSVVSCSGCFSDLSLSAGNSWTQWMQPKRSFSGRVERGTICSCAMHDSHISRTSVKQTRVNLGCKDSLLHSSALSGRAIAKAVRCTTPLCALWLLLFIFCSFSHTFWPIYFLSPAFCSCIFVRLIAPAGPGLNWVWDMARIPQAEDKSFSCTITQPVSPIENQQDIICAPRFIWILISFAPENKLYSSGDSFPSRNRECNIIYCCRWYYLLNFEGCLTQVVSM